MDNVQELMFYEQNIDIDDIETLIKGKELSQGAIYPFSVNELLIQVQERFMGNKFVPLNKRKTIIEKIDSLRKENPNVVQKIETKFELRSILPWLLSGIGIIISILGAVSLSDKFKRDKEVELDIGGNNNEDLIIQSFRSSSSPGINAAIEYEKLVGRLLEDLGAKIISQEESGPDKPVTRPDYIIDTSNGDFIVECKRYKSFVGLNTIRQFLYQTLEHGKNGIFVTASELTKRSIETVNRHNDVNVDMKVFVVQGTSSEELKKQLQKVLSNAAFKK
jgi:Restriction endonuclease